MASQAINSEWGSIVLSLAFLFALARRVRAICNSPKKIASAPRGYKHIVSSSNCSKLRLSQYASQIFFATVICIVHLTSGTGFGSHAHFYNGLAALNACLSAAISMIEHTQDVQSSHLVPAYLAVALAQDMHKTWNMACPTVFDCGGIKLGLCLEALWLVSFIRSWVWGGYLHFQVSASEDAAGLFSFVSFFWMSPMLREGYISTLHTAGLPGIHHMLSSRTLRTGAIKAWTSRSESIDLHFTIVLIFISRVSQTEPSSYLGSLSQICFSVSNYSSPLRHCIPLRSTVDHGCCYPFRQGYNYRQQ